MKRAQPRDIPLIRGLLYGQGGTGKTRLVASFDQDPRTARLLLLNAAGNPISIWANEPTPIVADLERSSDLNAPYDFLRSGQPEDHSFRKMLDLPPDIIFNTVAIDTTTEVQRIIHDEITGAGELPTLTGEKMRIQDWGESLKLVMHFVRLYYDLPMHVLFTAQERTEKDKEGRENISIFLQGQAGNVVPGYAELVGRLVRRTQLEGVPTRTSEPGRRIVSVAFWETGGSFVVKNQLAPTTMGSHMVEPTATKIMDQVEAYFTAQGAQPVKPALPAKLVPPVKTRLKL